MPATAFRLIVDGPVEGALNMALDRAVASARADGCSPPTLRLYRWEVPTITLGRFQPVDDVDLEAARAAGCDVARRPTGGRGVLHDDEITYSIVASVSDGVPRGVAASYRYLSEALAQAYARLGVDARLTPRSRGPKGAAACYLHATPADLSLGASKLSGSAQVWTGDTVLQHGSFVISRDVAREAAVFRLDAEAEARLADTTSTIQGATGRRPAPEEIEAAIAEAFGDVLGISFLHGEYSEEESVLAGRLACEHRIAVAAPR